MVSGSHLLEREYLAGRSKNSWWRESLDYWGQT